MSDYLHKPIVSTLGFILSADRKSVLMVHRTYRGDDENLGKYNGIGGKLERDEDVASGMIREIREETGLQATSMTLRGTVCWADFGPKKQDWLAFIFVVDGYTGTVAADNEEGTLQWVPLDRLPELPMWPGDRLFLPLVFDDDSRLFHGFMRYSDDTPVAWHYERF